MFDDYNIITGKKRVKRKGFAISTKRIEWERAGGKCRECKLLLKWGSGRYEFHHKSGNESDNSQRNCWLICKNCHGVITKKQVKRKKVTDVFGLTKTKVVKKRVITKAMKKTSRNLKKTTTSVKKRNKPKKKDSFGLDSIFGKPKKRRKKDDSFGW